MDATVVRSLVGSTLKVKWTSLVGFIASSILWLSLFAHPQNKTASELLTSAGNWLGLPERWGTDITGSSLLMNWRSPRRSKPSNTKCPASPRMSPSCCSPTSTTLLKLVEQTFAWVAIEAFEARRAFP